jgi:hypothetical protein
MSILLKKITQPLVVILGVLLLCLVSACSHYHLGRSGVGHYQTISIGSVANEGLVPQVQSLLRDQLVKAFVSDGTLQVLPESQAQLELAISVANFNQFMTASRADDSALARSYEVVVVADCTLTNQMTKEVLWRDEIPATLNLQVDSSFVDVQHQAMPALTRNLAEKIREAVLNYF